MIEENVKALLKEIGRNPFGEKVTLVAATKTRTADEINRAIAAGIRDVGENRVQEFREKNELVDARATRHFIGHLQTNKVKYLIGKVGLYHSVDRDELASEIAKRSKDAGIVSDILVQINIGNEESKGGYPLEAGEEIFRKLAKTDGLRVRGLMAMLPLSDDEGYLSALADSMRALYEKTRAGSDSVDVLSMGMSGDWRLCVSRGSNMVRLGTAVFGAR